MIRDTYGWLRNPYGVLDRRLRTEGPTFRLQLPLLGDCLVTGAPELVAAITNHHELDAGAGIRALRRVLGDGSLITLDGEAHLARKRLVAPPLQGDTIATFDATARDVTRAILTEARHAPFDVYRLTRRIGLRAILHFLFGTRSDLPLGAMETAVERFLASFQNPLVLYLKPLQRDLGPMSPWGRATRSRDALRSLIADELTLRKRGDVDGPDLLSRIARGAPALEPEETVTEVLSLLVFGHDTGAATLAWVFEHLYRAPDALRHAREELQPWADTDGCPTAEALPYTVACMRESMRLSPVVPHLTRVARRPLELCGHHVEGGGFILPSAYVAHHNPAVFDMPTSFRPERFLGTAPPKHAYFPFGLGTRTCIGERLVMRQMLQIVRVLVGESSLALLSPTPARAVRHLPLVIPEGGTQMRVCP